MGDYPDQLLPPGAKMLPPTPMGMDQLSQLKFIEECESKGVGGYHLMGAQYTPHPMRGIIYETNKDL